MPETVEGQVLGQPRRLDRRLEHASLQAPAEDATLRAEEHEVLGTRARAVRSDVGGELVDEEGRQSEGAISCFALRRRDDPDVAADLLEGLTDAEVATEEVHVADPQADRLAPTQSDRAGEEHECSVPRRHGAGEAQQSSAVSVARSGFRTRASPSVRGRTGERAMRSLSTAAPKIAWSVPT